MARSADISFRIIALQKRILSKDRLNQAMQEARERGISLEGLISETGEIPPDQYERILRTRRRHGRNCSKCLQVTYLLPGQKWETLPCEHCGVPMVGGARTAPPKPQGKRISGRPIGKRSSGAHPVPDAPAPEPPGRRMRESATKSSGRVVTLRDGDEIAERGDEHVARVQAAEAAPEVHTDQASGLVLSDSAEMPAYRPEDLEPPEPPTWEDPADDDMQFMSIVPGAEDAPPPPPRREPPPGGPSGRPIGKREPAVEPGFDYQPPPSDAARTIPEVPEQSDDRARKMRLAGAGFGYEPPPEAAAPAEVPEQSGDRARKMRLAGAGFGYEPPPKPSPTEDDPHAPEPGPAPAAGPPPVGPPPVGPPPVGPPPVGPPPGGPPSPEPAPGPAGYPVEPRRRRRLGTATYDQPDGPRPIPGTGSYIAGSLLAPGTKVPPVHQDLLNILLFPARNKEAVALLSVGALLILFGRKLPIYALAIAIVFLLYPVLYKIKVTRLAMQGTEDPPSWPDLDLGELVGTGIRYLAVGFACFVPACVTFPLAMGGSAMSMMGSSRPENVLSIGPTAVKGNAGEPYIPSGSAVDTSATVFWDVDDNPISLGGTWTIVGLLGQDRGNDVASEMLQDMPRGNLAGAVFDAYQIHDLDRVAVALPQVQVLGAYADPSERLINDRFPWTDPDEDYEDYEDEAEEEYEKDLARAMERAQQGARINTGGGWDSDNSKPRALTICKTDEHTFPPPLDKLKLYPCVVVLDPAGKVVRQYSSGVHDTKLYTDVQDLMRGGDGEVWSEEELPAHAYGIQGAPSEGAGAGAVLFGVFGWLAFGVALLFAALYYPMAWLMMVAFDSPSMPFMYPAGFRAMAKGWKDYLALVGILIGLEFVSVLVFKVVGSALAVVLPWFLEWLLIDYLGTVITFYTALVVAYGIGRFYAANAQEIGWFTSAPATDVIGPGDSGGSALADPYADPYEKPAQ